MFWATVSVSSRLYCWKTKPIRRRLNLVSAASPSPVSSVPSTITIPPSGRSSPAAHCNSVDFPEPEGPMTAVNVPRARLSVTPSSARTALSSLPYVLLTLTSRSASAAGPVSCVRRAPERTISSSPSAGVPENLCSRRYGDGGRATWGTEPVSRGVLSDTPATRCGDRLVTFVTCSVRWGGFTGGGDAGTCLSWGTSTRAATTGGGRDYVNRSRERAPNCGPRDWWTSCRRASTAPMCSSATCIPSSNSGCNCSTGPRSRPSSATPGCRYGSPWRGCSATR